MTQDDCWGLEMLSNSRGWINANPITRAFVINIADCFMRQTNGFFVSTVHCVINKSGRERYCSPLVFGFDRLKALEAVLTCVSESNLRLCLRGSTMLGEQTGQRRSVFLASLEVI